MAQSLTITDQIIVALRRITRAIDLRSRTLLQDYGLTVPQLATLKAISQLEPVPAGRIAVEIYLGQPTVTGILTRLERRGLIQRSRDEHDRRAVNTRLTEDGKRVLENAPSLLQDQFEGELSKLKEWEQTQVLATLQRIADMMDATRIEAIPVLTSELTHVTTSDSTLHLEDSASQTNDGAASH